ncbi:MAG: hypothetical protein F6K21_32160 [Symploca sp. SIO2D2]|nr:hypothetical protein [Symploca sp. SIO2D2]
MSTDVHRSFADRIAGLTEVQQRHLASLLKLKTERRTRPNERGELVAYVKLKNLESGWETQLRSRLESSLPRHMIPYGFKVVDSLPLLASGKIDRKRLASSSNEFEPEVLASGSGGVSPVGEVELALAAVWKEVLDCSTVSRDDNFFALGGDSIQSISVIGRLRAKGLRLKPSDFFAYPVLSDLAERVETTAQVQFEKVDPTVAGRLAPMQEWFFSQSIDNRNHWNISMLLEVRERIDPKKLEDAFKQVVANQSLLRSRFSEVGGHWSQRSGDLDWGRNFEFCDLSRFNENERIGKLERHCEEVQRSLDIESGVVVRFVYFRMAAPFGDRFLIVTHHLVSDWISIGILLEQASRVYEGGFGEEGNVGSIEEGIGYRDWIDGLSRWRAREGQSDFLFWRQNAQAITAYEESRMQMRESSVEKYSVFLSEDVTTDLLQNVHELFNTRPQDYLIAALVFALKNRTSEKRIFIDLEGHGREEFDPDLDMSSAIGWFTALYPLCFDTKDCRTLNDYLLMSKETLRSVPNGGIGYGALRYMGNSDKESVEMVRWENSEICFNYLGLS